MNDAENFQILCKCLTSVGVSHSEQDIIFRLISAVLSLGNVDFQSQETASEGAVAAVDESYTVDLAAELLGVKRDALEFILLNRRLSVIAESDGNSAAPPEGSSGVRASIYVPQTENVSRRRHSQYNIRRDVVQANYARDSMAKTIYQVSLFRHLVTVFLINSFCNVISAFSIGWSRRLATLFSRRAPRPTRAPTSILSAFSTYSALNLSKSTGWSNF